MEVKEEGMVKQVVMGEERESVEVDAAALELEGIKVHQEIQLLRNPFYRNFLM